MAKTFRSAQIKRLLSNEITDHDEGPARVASASLTSTLTKYTFEIQSVRVSEINHGYTE